MLSFFTILAFYSRVEDTLTPASSPLLSHVIDPDNIPRLGDATVDLASFNGTLVRYHIAKTMLIY